MNINNLHKSALCLALISSFSVVSMENMDFIGAILLGDVNLIQELIRRDPNVVNAEDSAGFSALSIAVVYGYYDVVKAILEGLPDLAQIKMNGEKIDIVEEARNWYLAGKEEKRKLIYLALRDYSNKPIKARVEALAAAKHPRLGSQSPVSLIDRRALRKIALLAEGNIFNAIEDNEAQKVRELIALDRNLVNKQDEKGNLPLFRAAMRGFEDIACIILDASPDLGIRNDAGRTVLQEIDYACPPKSGFRTDEINKIIGLIKQYKRELGQAVGASTHPRLGEKSPAGMVGQDVLQRIARKAAGSENLEEETGQQQ